MSWKFINNSENNKNRSYLILLRIISIKLSEDINKYMIKKRYKEIKLTPVQKNDK